MATNRLCDPENCALELTDHQPRMAFGVQTMSHGK